MRFFFGREGEREIICANLMASKLTVLYGDTGVGKSSVLRAGVAHSLRARGDALGVVVFDAWKDDPAAGLIAALAASANVDPRATLADTLEACAAKLDGDVYVILDGVEEYSCTTKTNPGRARSSQSSRRQSAARASARASSSPSARTRWQGSIASRPAFRTSSATTCGFLISTGKPRRAPSSALSIATTSSSNLGAHGRRHGSR